MSDEDISIDEKRVYAAKADAIRLYVATDLGVATVSVSADLVGEFSLIERCRATDVATDADRLAVATDEDVLVADRTDERFRATGFGPASAVTLTDGELLAGSPGGRVAREAPGGQAAPGEGGGERAAGGGTGWTTLGTVGAVRAIDGELVGTADGMFRVDGEGLQHVGLDDVRDVTTAGTPLAATGEGLFYLGPGWAQALDGAVEVVARDGERAHAASGDRLYECVDDEWQVCDRPVDESVAALGYGTGVYLVTAAGTVLVDVGDGWRSRSLGLRGVSGLAVGE